MLGGRARSHMRALANIEDVEIVAICDIKEETAQSATSEFGGTAYTDYRVMLDSENLTAMYVVVPTFAHYDAEILAAQQGVHMLLEKPVVPSMEKGLEILEAVQKSGVTDLCGLSTALYGLGKTGA